MAQNEELIWVGKEFAETYNKLKEDKGKYEERQKALDEYLTKAKDQVRSDFKASLDSLEEDAAIFSGLMLNVKRSFEKAKNEHLTASYELWEKFDSEMPGIEKKISTLTNKLNPLVEQLDTINNSLDKISTYNFEKVIAAIEKAANLFGKESDMFKFLISNFNTEKK